MNDVSVYLGRRRRGESLIKRTSFEAFSCSFCPGTGVLNIHEAKKKTYHSWFKTKSASTKCISLIGEPPPPSPPLLTSTRPCRGAFLLVHGLGTMLLEPLYTKFVGAKNVAMCACK